MVERNGELRNQQEPNTAGGQVWGTVRECQEAPGGKSKAIQVRMKNKDRGPPWHPS